ncbi:hypothetical protein KR018_007232 [Drosophila ironensis]|nr:hypothetical protein KR018_007232 [Drosophila ironensis]
MDQSRHFLHNVVNFSAGHQTLSQLERSAMAYKRLCSELETLTNVSSPMASPATPSSPPPSSQPVNPPVVSPGLRASASEFVPQVPPSGDRRAAELVEEQDEYSDDVDDGYNEERNMRSPRPAIYGFRFYNHHYELEDGGDSHSEAERKRKLGYRVPRFRPNQPGGRPIKTDPGTMHTAMPPKELANGSPHFKGPYMPLLQHRIANAEAYGLIRDPNEGPSMLLEDLIKQLSRLDKCPINLNSLFPGRSQQNPSS